MNDAMAGAGPLIAHSGRVRTQIIPENDANKINISQ